MMVRSLSGNPARRSPVLVRAARHLRFAVAALLVGSALLPSVALAQRKPPPDKPEKADKTKSEEKSLAVGENFTVPANDVKQYSEGTPGIVDVKLTPDNTKFVIVGQKPGSTTLLFIKNDGSQFTWVFNVFSKDPQQVERELRQLLEPYPGVRVRRVGPRLFIEGGVSSEQEAERIQQIATLYAGQVESLVTVGGGSIDRKINVRVDFFFVQYTKNSAYQFGLRWPTTVGGTAVQPTNLTATIDLANGTGSVAPVIVNQPLPALDIAAGNGWAKVLKQASVVTTNGNAASFASTGELNFRVTGGLAAEIQAITFGTEVKVLPRYDPDSRNLEVRVEADVNDLTPPVQGDLPGRQGAKLSTLVFLKLGQSLVLSGIRMRSVRHAIQGIPFLSQIPVLGVLFGTHNNQEEELEGAVFIIPSVVESVPKSTFDILKDALEQYQEFDGDMDEVNTFQKTPPAYDSVDR
jgi:pilus assembly protein CpaC